ncbi:hypothetical protein [Ralstonia flatus]|uniref:hypothetical protein n=1 Tax=Ralstonia flatus TaxID=3058601 RepID=UPI00197D1862|nr:hypothetical protein [Ralstonia sp. LMG 32965]MBN6207253.1 hypothetical protein [Ralstonia pickettii]
MRYLGNSKQLQSHQSFVSPVIKRPFEAVEICEFAGGRPPNMEKRSHSLGLRREGQALARHGCATAQGENNEVAEFPGKLSPYELRGDMCNFPALPYWDKQYRAKSRRSIHRDLFDNALPSFQL